MPSLKANSKLLIVNRKNRRSIHYLPFTIYSKARGFTLIELLVVISIIAILIAAGTFSWTNAQQKGRDAKRKTDLKSVQQALELYLQTYGRYPTADASGNITCSDGAAGTGTISWGETFQCPPGTGLIFMQKMPKDPRQAGIISQLANLLPKPVQTPRPQPQVAASHTGIFDSASSSSTAGGQSDTLSWSHTVGTGANRLLIVGVSIGEDKSVSTITYGSQGLTFRGAAYSGTSVDDARAEIWSLVNPTSGTNTITVNLDGTTAIAAGATSWTNVNQATPLGTTATGWGNSTSPQVNVTSAGSEVVVDTLSADGTPTAAVGAGQTQHWNVQGGDVFKSTRGAGSSEIGAAATTMSWTLNSSRKWALVAVAIKPAAPSPSQVAWWKFDEGSGPNAADSSGNGNAGTLINNPTWTTGRIGQALSFNGTTNYVSAPDSPSLSVTGNTITLAAWIKPSRTGANEQVVGKWGAGQDSYQFRINSNNGCNSTTNRITFRVESNSNCVLSNTALTAGPWWHVVGTYDGANLKIYINGELDATAALITNLTDKTGSFSVGRNDDGNYFQGVVDDVRIYNSALTAAEITNLYNAAPSPAPSPTPAASPSVGPTPTPLPGTSFVYSYGSTSPTTFILKANLENTSDPDLTSLGCNPAPFNYCVTNP
ncbi:prepilin-type N-terminal cleavage/methylation domain-containing protein [Candidatus Curtissbacteria bacterium]|nr:prepilin-type N-terminal cleavage/methylation domain-containing protein [Candidatus Curtissbacteria bacterium]